MVLISFFFSLFERSDFKNDIFNLREYLTPKHDHFHEDLKITHENVTNLLKSVNTCKAPVLLC